MNENELHKMAMEFILENSNRITQKMVDIMGKENNNEMKDIPVDTRRLIHNQAIFDLLKIVNMPISIMLADEDDTEFIPKYETFAESFRHTLSEMCEALYNWEPEKSY